MSRLVSLALLLVAVAGVCVCAQPSGPLPTTCSGQPNQVPLVQFDPATATLVDTVENGTLYSVLPSGMDTPLLIAHLYGDEYSQGYAYGQMLADTLPQVLEDMYSFFTNEYHISKALVDELLDITRNATELFTPEWHFQFLQGAADGSNGAISFLDLWRISMIPEATKAQCSITGAWGSATANGGLLQLRALDWGTSSPFQQWPLLTVFHYDNTTFNSHAALGWVGLYGTITGFSSANMAISEKLWDAYEGIDNIFGYPWNFMLQDIAKLDKDVDAGLARIATATRTCSIWIGLGQGARTVELNNKSVSLQPNFKLISSGWEEVHFYNPENFPFYENHDYFPDLVFVNKHVQPSGESCMNDLFHWGYGELTAQTFYENIVALEQTGDMHVAVTDFAAQQVYISNATPSPNASPAYNNGFVQIGLQDIWNQPRPESNPSEQEKNGIAWA